MATVSFQLPEVIEQRLRETLGDLNAAMKEAALVEFYRQQLLTHHQLAAALELDRFETEAVLKRHNVTEDSPTVEQHRTEMTELYKLMES